MKGNIYIIGCGGVGSWLAPALTLLTNRQHVILMDADILEEKNLDRQLFSETDLGRSKAEALAERYKCVPMPEWFCEGLLELQPQDWLIVCVDNHVARAAALAECDRHGCRAIIAANETHSAEAYYYERSFKGGPCDPRVYFPDILTDRSGDPRARGIGCTGEAQQENRQLVTSNAMAAALAGHLFALWHLTAPTLKRKTIESLPYRLVANSSRLENHIIKDKINQRTENEHRNNTTGSGDPARRGNIDSTTGTNGDGVYSNTPASPNA